MTSDSIGGLPAGIYEVIVSDSIGCKIDTLVAIGDSDGPDVEVDSIVHVDCNGSNTGFARIIHSGGPSETDPTWPCWGPSSERLAAGTYPVMVEDSNGCKTPILITISEPPSLVLSLITTKSNCNDSTGSATVVATGGTEI